MANAGGKKIVTLPASLVTLDGTLSTDDRKVVSYEWSRDPTSLAAGVSVCSGDWQRYQFLFAYIPIIPFCSNTTTTTCSMVFLI